MKMHMMQAKANLSTDHADSYLLLVVGCLNEGRSSYLAAAVLIAATRKVNK